MESSPEISLTGKAQGGSSSKANKTGMASKRKAISEMLKKVKDAVKKRFVDPPTKEKKGPKAIKLSLRLKKKNNWLKQYFNRRVSQVGILDGSCKDDWTPDIYQLIRWKKMASSVRSPMHRAIEESKEVD
jgi:hypothetical protein